ncbi:MAG: zinc ribbon domain-containing protein [Candidatus Omnitrophota bacterium]
MPIYEYECIECKKTTELLIGVSQSKVEIQCAHCGSKKLRKKISSGFVSTGSKNKQEFCAQKGPCQAAPSCMFGGGCHA